MYIGAEHGNATDSELVTDSAEIVAIAATSRRRLSTRAAGRCALRDATTARPTVLCWNLVTQQAVPRLLTFGCIELKLGYIGWHHVAALYHVAAPYLWPHRTCGFSMGHVGCHPATCGTLRQSVVGDTVPSVVFGKRACGLQAT